MIDFDIKELSNIKFSHDMLVSYYNRIKNNYQHLKWTPTDIDTQSHKVSEVYSWAIQSNLKDPSKPCPPYDIKHDDQTIGTFNNETDLMFDFGQVIVDTFPEVRQTVISGHPAGTEIQQHRDNAEFFKIHIPIETNDQSFFVFGDKSYNLEIGKAYFINTQRIHGTVNNGITDRVHLIFKIPYKRADEILENDWILDPTHFDFDIMEIDYDFNYSELLEYYNTIDDSFGEFRWQVPDMRSLPKNKRPMGYETVSGIYGYAIQSNLKDIDQPCPAFNNKNVPREEKIRSYTNKTKLFFGFAEKIFKDFNNVEEMVITSHPQNTGIGQHIDSYSHFRIHLPIFANNKSYFIFGDKKYLLETGKAYIVNTSRYHGTFNYGETDRTHLLFKVPLAEINLLMSQKVK